jgi:hypothetical protein
MAGWRPRGTGESTEEGSRHCLGPLRKKLWGKMCRTWPWDTGDQKNQAGHEPCAQPHQQWRRRRIVHSSRRTRWSP